MAENSIKNMLQATLEGLDAIADVNTIFGQSVETKDGTVIIPVSKMSFGFVAGGSDFPNKNDVLNCFGGGGGGGCSIDPVAFLVVSPTGDIRLMDMNGDSNVTANILAAVPNLVDGIISKLGKKDKE